MVVKVYASGGENATHAHRTEDHVFFVLGGKAKFHLGRGGEDVVVVEKFDGIYLPQESYYRFTSVGEENLVMLRVGSLVRAQAKGLSGPERIDAEGKVFPGDSLLNGPYMERREEPGVRFEG